MPEFRSFDGVTLHYDVEGEGAPVVLLHGFVADTNLNWRQPGIIPALTAAGLGTIGLDARGHGQSQKCYDPSAYENEAMVADVGALFDHLHLGEADVAGYSMGAATALRFAMTDGRVRRLVLGGSDGNLADSEEEILERERRMAAGLEAEDPEDIADPVVRRFRRLADATGADRRALAASRRGQRRAPLSRDRLRQIEVPALVICGEADVSPYELAAALPAGQARVVPGDHMSAVLEPALATAIVEFLT
jgi:pimeloyl-ACP methyl ester carboxylesterase